MNTLIISAYPASGKTYTTEHQSKYKIYDLDSKDYSGDPDFPNNYINKLKELISSQKYDIIFVSSHVSVRKCLTENKIPFICVLPESNNESVRNEFIGRMFVRGNDEKYIKNMIDNWDLHVSGQGYADESYTYRLTNSDYIDEQFIEDIISYEEYGIEDAVY